MRVGTLLIILSAGNFVISLIWIIKFLESNIQTELVFSVINGILGFSMMGVGAILNKKEIHQ